MPLIKRERKRSTEMGEIGRRGRGGGGQKGGGGVDRQMGGRGWMGMGGGWG